MGTSAKPVAGRAAVLSALALLLLAAGVAGAWTLLEPRFDRRSAPGGPSTGVDEGAEETETGRASTRRPILPLRPEQLARATSGVDPRWATLNNEAIAALEAGETAKAVEMLERCLGAEPDEVVFARNLAEALARLAVAEDELGSEEDRARAVLHLSRAADLAPAREDIRKRLEQMKRLAASESGFTVESSEHFELSYDGTRTQIVWSTFEIVKPLENAYQDFGEVFGTWPVEGGRRRIRVVLYEKSGFHEATGMGHWAAGVFDGAIRVPVEDLGRERDTLERVLRHELAHFFVRETGGTQVPGWLNEGLAQWLEPRTVVARAAEFEKAREHLEGKTLLPLEKLQGSLIEIGGEDELSIAYAEALLLCGWIERSFGERLLFDLVAASKTPEGWRGAFRRRTGLEIDAAVEELSR